MPSETEDRIHLVRITTAPISMRLLLTGQPQYMHDSGFRVSVISAEGEDWKHIPDQHKMRIYKIPMARQIALLGDIIALFRLIILFIRIKPDIVHTHTPKAGLLGMLAAAFTLVPVRIHTVAGLPLLTTGGLKRKILVLAEKLTYFCADEVWINSPTLRKTIIEQSFVKKYKTNIILSGSSNGIDLTQFHPAAVPDDRVAVLREEHCLHTGHYVFVAVGRMVGDKGIPELITAFSSLYKRYENARLVLLGPFEEHLDPLPADTKMQLQNHAGIVHIHWSDEVNVYMKMASCFVHASHREGFPNVVLQAAAMGLPVILSNIPGNIDIVTREEEGFVYPVKNAAALEKCMQHCLDNPALAQEKAGILQQKVRSQFSRPVMHEAIKINYIRMLQLNHIDVQSIV